MEIPSSVYVVYHIHKVIHICVSSSSSFGQLHFSVKTFQYPICDSSFPMLIYGLPTRFNTDPEFITEVDSLTNGAVPVLFFFYPKDLREISFLLRRDSIHIPVCIDKQNRMNRINHFPSHQMYQCFLVDKENKVICIGNPVHNRKIRDIYLSTISNGKHNPSVQPSGITRIEADKTEFDLGSLKEGDSRKICVTIRNIGKLPLIIHDARTSCGCVHIDYIKRPVVSGNTTEINLTYHANKKGPIHKTVSIYGNMDTSPLTINLKGEVKTN